MGDLRMLFACLRHDWKVNFHFNNPKPIFIVWSYRISSYFALHSNKTIKFVGLPIRILYRLIIEWIMGAEIPDSTRIGCGLVIHHGVGLVIHPSVVLGDYVTLRHNTTLGHKFSVLGVELGAPNIHDFVDVGANCVIIGPITVGRYSIIGAGSVVVKDVPEYSVVVGNPAKVISRRNVD